MVGLKIGGNDPWAMDFQRSMVVNPPQALYYGVDQIRPVSNNALKGGNPPNPTHCLLYSDPHMGSL